VDEYLAAEDPETTSVAETYGYPIGTWDVSGLADFSNVFNGFSGGGGRNPAAASFNEDVSGWNVSSATTMYRMFYHAASFNQDVAGWNTSSVTDMEGMFHSTDSFNQDVSGWDTSSVTTMQGLFYFAKAFNQDVSAWDVGQVTKMQRMFLGAGLFNQNLCSWGKEVPALVDMVHEAGTMFDNTTCPEKGNPDASNLAAGPWCHACSS
jgi:surface protein